MDAMTNVLVQLGEALGPGESLAALLLLAGGSVSAVMSVRRIKDDHDRLEGKIEDLHKETRESFRGVRTEFNEFHSRLDRILEHLPLSQ